MEMWGCPLGLVPVAGKSLGLPGIVRGVLILMCLCVGIPRWRPNVFESTPGLDLTILLSGTKGKAGVRIRGRDSSLIVPLGIVLSSRETVVLMSGKDHINCWMMVMETEEM